MDGYNAGDLIMISNPFVYILNNDLRGLLCDTCFKSSSTLLRCSKCAFAYYCNKDCQKKAWLDHKQECKNIMQASPNVPSDSLRLISRIIYKIKNNNIECISESAGEYSRTFSDLMSHAEHITQDLMRCQQAMALYGTLKLFIGEKNMLQPSEFMEIFGKMMINSFDISDEELKTIGCGLYLGASILDHSCNPNATVVFHGPVLHVRALSHISSTDLRKVYISYIEQMETTEKRQRKLNTQYYFLCSCSRCLDDSLNDLMLKVNSSSKDDETSAISSLTTHIENLKIMRQNKENSKEILESSKNLLDQFKTKLTEFNVLRIRLLDLAFDACIDECLCDEALYFGLQTLKSYRLYYGSYHPNFGLQLFRIGKLQLHLEDMHNAKRTLLQAKEALAISHGTNHSLYEKLISAINNM